MRIALESIQKALVEGNLDGWLLYDFHGSNPIANLLVEPRGFVSRRWYCWLPRQSQMEIIHHTIEMEPFAHLAGKHRQYHTWKQLDSALQETLSSAKRIVMEYSPENAIPSASLVDGGTLEKVKALGVEIASSADLVARFLASWTTQQVAGHRRAAAALIEIKDQAFKLIADKLSENQPIGEYDVVSFIRAQFEARGLQTDDGPICAVGPHTGNPHYVPTAEASAEIAPDQLVLLDLWAREKSPDAVYADITWTAFTGRTVPDKMAEVFSIVSRARDRAVSYLNERLDGGEAVMGCEVDDATRAVIDDSGFGDRFVHRTGHSIGTDVHGIGPNIDNLETQDRRRLQKNMCFSVEPGIYLEEFGIRSEIDVLIHNGRAEMTTLPLQTEIATLLP